MENLNGHKAGNGSNNNDRYKIKTDNNLTMQPTAKVRRLILNPHNFSVYSLTTSEIVRLSSRRSLSLLGGALNCYN